MKIQTIDGLTVQGTSAEEICWLLYKASPMTEPNLFAYLREYARRAGYFTLSAIRTETASAFIEDMSRVGFLSILPLKPKGN